MPPNSTADASSTSANLECGASLSERAHIDQIAPTFPDSTPEPTSSAALAPTIVAKTAAPRDPKSIEELRDQIAVDANDGEGPTMFWSPHELDGKVALPMVYCDQTASNRPLQSMERYLQQACLPYYGNTHTNTSITGSQSTAFCAEARQLVAEAVNAKTTGKASQDVVLFTGNGTTAAVELLLDCLGFHHMSTAQNSASRPIIFIGPFEHHSNLLPWRESGAEIVMIPELNGQIDMVVMERLLQKYRSMDVLKIGTFTAASNVTGTVIDTNAITAMLHQYGALAIWDYATGAPYLDMNMNPMDDKRYPSALLAKDAIFFSPHKMVGGINTPGVLVIKKRLVQQANAPKRSGGGTVFYVTQDHHRFLSNRIERYEGGTPNVVGIWRVGLTMLFKRQMQIKYELLAQNQLEEQKRNDDNVISSTIPRTVLEYEYRTYEQVAASLHQSPNLVLLGDNVDDSVNHLPIFSFLIKCGQRFLHYNYVCALLNDIFGIQSRGGCQCAGPYSQRLLGLTEIDTAGIESPTVINDQVEKALVHAKERAELLRPGFTRLSLPFKGVSSLQVDYVVNAVGWVANHGWALLPSYRCNHRTGEWRHKQRQGAPLGKQERRWLSHYSISSSTPAFQNVAQQNNESTWETSLENAMKSANELLEKARHDAPGIQQALKMTDEASGGMGDADLALEELRWYVYPKEVATYVAQGSDNIPGTMERDNLLGALRPIAWFPKSAKLAPAKSEEPAVSSDNANATEAAGTETNPVVPIEPQLDALAQPSSSLYAFRDGEHEGEAPREEIEEGFDDGELSDDCLVYIPEKDDWISVQSFIGVAKSLDNGQEDESSPEVKALTQPSSAPKTDLVLPVDEKNQKKKPSRDSTAWGQGTFVTIKPPEVSTVAVPESAEADTVNETESGKRRKGAKHTKPPPKLMRLVTQAMMQWDMLEDGDRLLLGLSGGKDSLSLLHILMEFQRKLPIKFEIEVCTIDPMTPSFDPSPLIEYVESLGLKYHYIKDDIVERANSAGDNGQMVSSLCAFCARMKRGLLYNTARENNCNKLVLAQHLDDLAESFMMSIMHNGFLRTMKAHYKINAGDLSVIRPLVYCRENLTTDFAKSANLPIINENCPACFEEPKERARIKKLLQREESLFPNFYDNIKRSLLPLMHDDATGILRSYAEEALAKSRKVKHVKKKPNKDGSDKVDDDKSAGGDAKSMATAAGHPSEKTTSAVGALSEASEDDLIRELAKRRADRYRLAGASSRNKRLEADDGTGIPDPTGMVCSLNGGNGTIPCRELME